MMKSEFIERVGFEPTAAEYADIEAEYMGTDVDKDRFCKEWKKNGGVQRLMRLRARRIEELEAEIAKKDRQYDEMDTRYCKRINDINQSWKNETENLKLRLKTLQQLEADARERILVETARAEEAERKFAVLREAFAILGIGKEVQE